MRLLTAYVELKPKLSPGFNAEATLAGKKAGQLFNTAFAQEMKAPKLKTDLAGARRAGSLTQKSFLGGLGKEVNAPKLKANLAEARRVGSLTQKAFSSSFKPQEIKVNANLDSAQARSKLDLLTRDRKVNVRVDMKGGGLTGGGGGGGGGKNLSSLFSGGAGGELPSITGILSKSSTGISGLMAGLKASVVALSPILVSLAASAGFASTSLVAIGPAALGAATGVGTAIVAFSGVVAALKLYNSTQKQAGQADDQAAARTKAVRDARDSLAAATRGVTSAQEDYKASERNVARAQQDARDTQKDLNNARKEAAQDLMDLKELVSDLANDEEGAQIAIARALEEQKRVNADATSSILDKREAAHNLAEAEDRLNDIQTKRAQSMEDLTKAEAKGVNGSDKVISAQRAQQDATQKVKDAQLDLKHSQEAITVAIQAQTKATEDLATAQSKGGTAAQQQLNQAIADMSPEGRKMYYQLVKMKEGFVDFRKEIETATLPGFNSALVDLGKKGKDGTSTLSIIKNAMLNTGREISDGTSRLGKFVSSPFFKRSLTKMTDNNTEAFHHLNNAVIVLLRPITRLFTASSPLVVRMSVYVEKLANIFDHWVQSFSDKQLENYFKGAGDELGKWWTLAVNLGASLMNIFKLSLPTGSSLIDRLDAFSLSVRRFTESKDGQAQIGRFFAFFKNIDYGQMVKIVAQTGLLLAAFSGAKFAVGNPLFAFLGLMAKRYPKQTADFLEAVSGSLIKVMDYVAKNKAATNTLLGILLAYGALKGISNIKLPNIFGNLPGGSKVAAALGDWVKISPAGRGGTPATPLYVLDVGDVAGGAPGIGGGKGKKGKGAGRGAAKAGEEVAEDVGKAGRFAKFGKVALAAAGVADIAGLLIGGAADLGAFGGKGSKGKRWGQTAGAVAGGAGLGAAVGSVIPVVGTAVGAAVGAAGGLAYSIFRNKKIQADLQGMWKAISEGFMKYLGSPIADFVTKTIPNFFMGLPGKIGDFLKDLPNKMAYLGGQAVGLLIVGIVKGIPTLAHKFMDGMTWVGNIAKKGIDTVVTFFASLPARAEAGIKSLIPKFQNAAQQSGKFFQELPGKIVLFLADLPNKVWGVLQKIPPFFGNMWDSAKTLVLTGINGLIGIINSFLSGVNSVTSKFGINVGQITKVGEKKSGGLTPSGKGGGIGGNDFKGNALGGKIHGAGTTTSDSIIRRLSDKEYVIKASSAEKIGTKNLDYANETGRLPGYAQGGQVSIDQIIAVMNKSGLPAKVNATNPAGYHGPSHGAPDGGYHDSGQAVDFGTFNSDPAVRDQIAKFWYGYKSSLLELIHSSTAGPPYKGWYVKNGKDTAPYGPASKHYNHVHVAMTRAVGEAILAGKTPPSGDGGGFLEQLASKAIGALATPFENSIKSKAPPIGAWVSAIIKKVVPNIGTKADAGQQKMELSNDSGITDVQAGQLEGNAATNAKIIMDTTAKYGGSLRDQTIAVATAWVESKLKNLNFAVDHDSLGLFQQRDAWGPAGLRTTPTESTRLFLSGGMGGQRGLFAFPNRGKKSMGQAAQDVQVSGYPKRYDNEGVPVARRFTHYTGYDSGGWLPPGDTLVRNNTGKPEAVLTNPQINNVLNGGNTIVKVFIGDREITDIVRTEVTKADSAAADRFRHGRSY